MSKGAVCPNCLDELQGYFFKEIVTMFSIEKEYEDYMDNITYSDFYDDDEYEQTQFKPKKYNNTKENTSSSNNNKLRKINVNALYKDIIANVIGQDEAVKNIIATIVKNNLTDNPYFKSNMFLIGGTGTGKSETIKQIAKRLDIPYVIEDASKYTQEGYVGESVDGALAKLISAANGDIKKAERGIVIFDEIDKKTSNGENSGVSTTSVQDSLLKMLEGAVIKTSIGTINTEFITFGLIGSCENTYKAREKRLKGKGKIGFNKEELSQEELEQKNPNFIPEDLIEGGFRAEIIGRSDLIQEFNQMDVNMALEMINNSKISIFNIYIKELKKLGVEVKMNREEVVQEIAKRAVSLKVGARGIRQIVVEMFKGIYSEILVSSTNSLTGYDLYINKKTVYNNKEFKLCKKDSHK